MKRINSFLTIFVTFVVFNLILSVCIAAAQEASSPGWGDVFVTLFANYVAPVFGAALIILVTALVKRLFTKFGINISADQERQISAFAERAVRAMEELAAKSIHESCNKITGGQKLRDVISLLIEKFPKLTEDEAKQYALAAVNTIPGIGLTGNNPIPVGPVQGVVTVNTIKQ